MTKDEKKEVLLSYRAMNAEADGLLAAKEELMARATRVTPRYGISPRRAENYESAASDAVHKLIELEKEINSVVDCLAESGAQIIASVSKIDDSRLRTVLIEKYINGKTFFDIADKMGYSLRRIQTLHEQALETVIL